VSAIIGSDSGDFPQKRTILGFLTNKAYLWGHVILWPILVQIFKHIHEFPEADKLALMRIIYHISLIEGEINKHQRVIF
jgi:diadenosine tetraphosphate (Ap4A) HIT family hydrolase